MSTDRELLELAAKAVGYDTSHSMNAIRLLLTPPVDALLVRKDGKLVTTGWNPLTDDGDALRLAVALRLSVKHGVDIWDDTNSMSAYAYYRDVGECQFEPHGDDPHAATRRAIVRAAAEIGKAMP